MSSHHPSAVGLALLLGCLAAACAAQDLGVSVTLLVPEPVVTVAPAGPVVVTEGGLQALVQVSLNTSPGGTSAVIPVTSSDPTEMTPSVSSLTFTNANWAQPQLVLVTGVDDVIADGNQSSTLVLGAIVGSYFDGLDPTDVGVITQDDEVPSIVLTATGGGTSVSESGTTDSYSVTLAVQPSGDVTVSLLPDSQLSVSSPSLVFTSTNWNQAQAITVTAIDDTRAQGNRSALIGHRATGGGYTSASRADISVDIVDDDAAAVLASPTSITVSELGTTAQVRISLRSRPTANVTVATASSRTSEATVAPSLLTFTSDNWSTEQALTVTGVDDTAIDGGQPFTITLTSGGDAVYAALAPTQVFGINQDDDSANVLIRTNAALAVAEGGTATASYAVRLTQQPTAPVTVTVSPDAQVTTNRTSLTFTATTWSVEQTVTVSAVDDTTAESSPHVGAVSHAWTSADAGYNSSASLVVNAGITDNDTPSIQSTPLAGLETTETGGTATFTVRLGSRPAAAVSVPLASSDTGQGTVSPAALSFDSANWSTPQTVTITGADANSTNDGDVAYAITIGPSVSGDAFYGGLTGSSISVVNRAVDQAPTVAAVADLVTSEDPGATSIALSGIGSGQTGEVQALTVTATSDNTALTGTPSVTYASPGTTGTITITPTADAHGVANIAVAVSDGATTTTRSFRFTVTAVNDPPVVVRTTRLTVGYHGTGQVAPLAGDPSAPSQLGATDVETAAGSLLIRLLLAPNLGQLRRIDPVTGAATILLAGDAFAQADIGNGLIRYTHTSTSGSTDDAFQFAVEDGSGGSASAVYAIRIDPTVPAVDLLPTSQVTYVEDAGPLLIADQSLVADQNSTDFGSGRLEVTLAANGAATDVLDIADEGTGAGQIGHADGSSTITYGGAVIGTLSGGTGGTALTVTLTGNATPAATQALLRRLTFRSTSQAPSAATRTVRVVVTDDLGFSSTPADRQVLVQPVNDAPVVAALELTTAAGVPTPGQLVVTDPDGPTLALSVTVSPVKGTLTAFDAATGAFTYRPAGGQSGPDQFTVVASDGTASSAAAVVDIAITGGTTSGKLTIVSDPPLEHQAGDALIFTVKVDISELGAAPDLVYQLLSAPTGMVVVPDAATSTAVVSWTAPASTVDHLEFQVLVVDRVSRTAAVQWIALYVHPLPAGAQ